MPASKTTIRRSASLRRTASRAAFVIFGSRPRRASFAPSSRMTASVPSGTDQSRRPSPPDAVSPDTPAFVIVAGIPFALRARASFAGNVSSAGKPKPALSESPRTTTRTGLSAAFDAAAGIIQQNNVSSSQAARRWTRAGFLPYERCCEQWGPMTNNSQAGPAIALAGVNLSLGQGAARVHILKDIDLHIGSGEAIGLVGPSGSGKSTLLMVMAGLERADSGTVTVAGENLNALDEDALARFRGRQVGIVFQSFHLIPTMTALENVAVPLELAGNPDAARRATEELHSVGLGDRLHHYPTQLSGGEQQRVALARALAPNPAILIADEPTGNLDETTGSEIIDLLFAGHAQRGTTLVLVTHDAALAARCDRVVRLRSGRIEDASRRETVEA